MDDISREITTCERFLALTHEIEPVDALLVFGHFDMEVPRWTAKLLRDNVAPIAIISGARGRYSMAWTKTEAEVFAEVILQDGVIESKRLYLDHNAKSTPENIDNAVAIVRRLGLDVQSWGLVCRELQALRTFQTFVRRCPDVRARSYPPPGTMYHPTYGSTAEYLTRLTAEFDRLERYGAKGDLVPVRYPDEVRAALERLRKYIEEGGRGD